MILGYLATFIRHLKKHWSIALLNIFSYGMGVAACIIIMQHILYETSYDKFHENYQETYRLQLDHYYSDAYQNSTAVSFYPLGDELKKRYPEVQESARMEKINNASVTVNQNTFLEDRIFFVDSTLFDVLSFNIIKGTRDKVTPKDVFISEKIAGKYFGSENPIGGTIRINNYVLQVKGVFSDLPDNSHIKCDFLRIVTYVRDWTNDWQIYSHYTYITLKGDPNDFNKRLEEFSEELSLVADQQSGVEYKFLAKLQPLSSIHLESDLQFEHELNGSLRDVYVLFGIAIMILLISNINYVNMTNTINSDRSKETFMRKIHGASRRHALSQHVVESFVLNLFGFGVAVLFLMAFIYWVGPAFDFSDLKIDWSNSLYYQVVVGIFLVSFILSGILPAVLSSSSNLAQFLSKSSPAHGSRERFTRNIAIAQFVISYILISGALVATKQLRFLHDEKLGFDPDRVIGLTIKPLEYPRFETKFKRLREDLESNSSIQNASYSYVIPGETFKADASIRFTDESSENSKFCFLQMISPNYFDTYGIEIIAGRTFSDDRATDVDGVILNESLVRDLNVKSNAEVIGRQVTIPYFGEYGNFKVLGIVNDYHHESIKQEIQPQVFFSIRNRGYCGKISVQMSPTKNTSWKEDVDFVQNTLATNFSEIYAQSGMGVAAAVKDMKVAYYDQYSGDEQISKLVSALAFLGILMAGIGFFGLASSTTRKRTKEMAIRKINGAPMINLAKILVVYFLKLVGIAFVFSLPISYYLVQGWLSDFPIRISLGFWFVLWPLLITAVLTVVSVSYHIIKVVLVNPVYILRNE